MTTIKDVFGTNDLGDIADIITSDIVARREREQKSINQVKKQREENKKRNSGVITPCPGHPQNVDISKLVFDLSNHTVGDVWCLPNNRRRIDDILRHSKYTYLDAVIASIINAALEGNITAARTVLGFVNNYMSETVIEDRIEKS